MKRILLIIGITTMVVACKDSNKVSKIYKNVSLNKVITDTLIPKEDGSYTTKLIKLKGTINDSVYASFGEGYNKMYFKGNLDTIIGVDYYGAREAVFVFDPYKSKSGNLDVEFSIQ